MKLFKRILLSFFIIFISVAVGLFFYLQYSKPIYEGVLSFSQIKKEVKVYNDTYGIPHIYAESATDAYFALGYVHAQERLFQMEMIRRVGSGELAEILGKDFLQTDKFFRTIGTRENALKSEKEFEQKKGTELYNITHAYLDGINEYLNNGKTPVEFTVMGIEKREFNVRDMYYVSGYMAFSFAQALKSDPLTDKMYEKLGDNYLNDLSVNWPQGSQKIPTNFNQKYEPKINNDLLSSHDIEKVEGGIFEILNTLPAPAFIGSNSWAVAPSKSKSGKAMLANDTHIQYAQPSVWFEAHLEYPGTSLYGNFMAAVPFCLVGHSLSKAWGITMFENDDVDLYREKYYGSDSLKTFYKDSLKIDLTISEEIVKVKGMEDQKFYIRKTSHGPIVNDFLSQKYNNPISMYWTYNDFPNQLVDAFYYMNHSKNIDDFRKGVQLIHAPGLNITYADQNGNIASWAAAKLVKRPSYVNSKNILNGSSGKDENLGYYDFAYNPTMENPASGYVYTANNQHDTTAGLLYPGYYPPEDRAMRLVELIGSRSVLDLQDFKTIGIDITSTKEADVALVCIDVLKEFMAESSFTPIQKKAFDSFENWKGEHAIESIGPVIYYKILYNILKNSMQDELGEKDFEEFLSTEFFKNSYPKLFKIKNSIWWDDVSTKDKVETRSKIFKDAFVNSINELQEQLGADVSNWKWGNVHTTEFPHPLGQVALLKSFFNVGPFPSPGGTETVNNSGFKLNGDGIYNATFGPQMRIVLDFADVKNSESVIPSGQSGNFMSPHYADQAQLYIDGKYRKQLMDKDEIIKLSKVLVFRKK
jgi:penicillin G amidase